jgi:exodeoxyribonuclease VII small subunit
MTRATKKSDSATARYDESIAELEALLEEIEDPDLSIDDLAPKVERAAVLIRVCRSVLERTELQVARALETLDRAAGAVDSEENDD